MYHYYVRYSVLNERSEKVGEGDAEVKMNQKISQFSHIEYMKEKILNKIGYNNNYAILIDFYQLLRKEPD